MQSVGQLGSSSPIDLIYIYIYIYITQVGKQGGSALVNVIFEKKILKLDFWATIRSQQPQNTCTDSLDVSFQDSKKIFLPTIFQNFSHVYAKVVHAEISPFSAFGPCTQGQKSAVRPKKSIFQNRRYVDHDITDGKETS